MADPSSDIGALRRLQEWRGVARIEDVLRRLRNEPNLFTAVPHLLRVEGVHSDLLAWFLRPESWHGLDDTFVRRFVHLALAQCHVTLDQPLQIDGVDREFSTGRGPIDILVRGRLGGRELIVGIENKIDSPESEDQLHRYGEGLRAQHSEAILLLVLLAPDHRQIMRQPNCGATTLAYGQVASLLVEVLADRSNGPRDPLTTTGLTLANQYAAALRNHIMDESNPEIDALCVELYEEHRQAWRAIRRRLPSERDEVHERIAAAVCAHLTQSSGGSWAHVIRPNTYARVFRPEWKALGVREEQPLIGIQESDTDRSYAALHFRLVAEPYEGDSEQRFGYAVRFKGPSPMSSPIARQVADSVRNVEPSVPTDKQFTVPLKSTTKQPAVREDQQMPDDLLNWFTRHMAGVVEAVDAVLAAK